MSRILARKPVGTLTLNYASTNVLTSAWAEISAAIPSSASAMEIFSGSGSILKIAFSVAAAEDANVYPYTICPGGSVLLLPVELFKSKRLAAKAINSSATVGYLVINFFG